MRILVIITDQNEIIAAIENVVISEIDNTSLQQAINEHYDHVDAVIKSISDPNMMGEISIVMEIKDEDENTYTEMLTLKPSYLYQPAVTAAPPVNGIDYKLLDEQRKHIADILINIDTQGDAHFSDGDIKALDGIQALLDHISDTHVESQEDPETGNISQAQKKYYIGIGMSSGSKYAVCYHDGIKQHRDGSAFWDIALFKSKVKTNVFVKKLQDQGYTL